MKELLQPLIEAKKFKMTRALRVLREDGWLKNWDTKGVAEKITAQVKGYCKRERRNRREGFWKGSYGEFASVVASRLVDAEKIEEMVEAGEYDRFVVLMSDISGDKKTTFYVGATIRSLSYAPVQELGRGFAWATTDGTGRCNYNGKIVISASAGAPAPTPTRAAPRGAPRPSPAVIARPATRSSPPRPPVAAPPRPQAQRPPPVVGPVVTLPASLPLVQDDVLAGLDASFFDDAPGPAIPSPKRARVA